jgi:hypothetical protein
VSQLADHGVELFLEHARHLGFVGDEEEVAAARARNLGRERSVELDSDSDRGESDLPPRRGLRHADEALGIGAADIGLLVGEQHQPGVAAELRSGGEGGVVADLEARLHVGRAGALDAVDGGKRLVAVAADVGGREVEVRDVAVEHDRQLVALAHLADDLAKAAPDEVERAPRHRSGFVDHRDQVERLALPGRRIEVRGEAEADEEPVVGPAGQARGHRFRDQAEELGAGLVRGEVEVVLAHQPFDGERLRPRHADVGGDRAEMADVLRPALADAGAGDDDRVGGLGFLLLLGRRRRLLSESGWREGQAGGA